MRAAYIDIARLRESEKALLQNAGLFSSEAWTGAYEGRNRQVGIFNDNNELIGSFQLFAFKKYGLTILINPPFSPHINLHYINPAQTPASVNAFNKQVMQCIAEFLLSLKAHYIKLNFAGSVVDTQALVWKGFQVSNRFTYVLDLNLDEEVLYTNLSSEKKKSLRKAEKDGLVIEESQDYQTVLALIEESLQRHDKFRNGPIIRNLLLNCSGPGRSMAFVARDNSGKAIATAYCVISGGKAYYVFGGFSETGKHHGAGVSCMWACIRNAKALGLTEFDFEGSMVPEIEKYFREFGGQIKALQEISHKRFPYKQLSAILNK